MDKTFVLNILQIILSISMIVAFAYALVQPKIKEQNLPVLTPTIILGFALLAMQGTVSVLRYAGAPLQDTFGEISICVSGMLICIVLLCVWFNYRTLWEAYQQKV